MQQLLQLQELNLTNKDTLVYETLLSLGPSSIRSVAETSGINRGSVYESIKHLEAAGLVSHYTKVKQKRYFAEEPEKLMQLAKDKQESLDILQRDLKAVLPKLKSKSSKIVASNVHFYEDADGVAVILRDVLATMEASNEKSYRVISSKPIREYLYQKFPSFTRQRISKKIHVDVIAIGEGGDKVITANRKWLKANGQEPSSYVIIYGNKVATIGLTETNHVYGVVTEDIGVARMQNLLFKNIWDSIT